MSILLFVAFGSVSLLGLVRSFQQVREKAENKGLSAVQQRILAEARAKAWREDKQRFMH